MELVDKDYVKKKLARRKGQCLKCGQCCKGCKHLDGKTKLCNVYNNRPEWCHKDFPINELDKKVFDVDKCGYGFD